MNELLDLLLVGTPTEIAVTACQILRRLGDIPDDRANELECIAGSADPELAAEGCELLLRVTPRVFGRERVFVDAIMRHPRSERVVLAGLHELATIRPMVMPSTANAVIKALRLFPRNMHVLSRVCHVLDDAHVMDVELAREDTAVLTAMLPHATADVTASVLAVFVKARCFDITQADIHALASAMARHVQSPHVAINGCDALNRLVTGGALLATPGLGKVLFAVQQAAAIHPHIMCVMDAAFEMTVRWAECFDHHETYFRCDGFEVSVLAAAWHDNICVFSVATEIEFFLHAHPHMFRRTIASLMAIGRTWRDDIRVVNTSVDIVNRGVAYQPGRQA